MIPKVERLQATKTTDLVLNSTACLHWTAFARRPRAKRNERRFPIRTKNLAFIVTRLFPTTLSLLALNGKRRAAQNKNARKLLSPLRSAAISSFGVLRSSHRTTWGQFSPLFTFSVLILRVLDIPLRLLLSVKVGLLLLHLVGRFFCAHEPGPFLLSPAVQTRRPRLEIFFLSQFLFFPSLGAARQVQREQVYISTRRRRNTSNHDGAVQLELRWCGSKRNVRTESVRLDEQPHSGRERKSCHSYEVWWKVQLCADATRSMGGRCHWRKKRYLAIAKL